MATIVQIAYTVAYNVLPMHFSRDLVRTKKMWAEGLAGPYFYSVACRTLKTEASAIFANQFIATEGNFDDQQHFYLMQYPAPPPIDYSQIRPDLLPNASVILAPFFSMAIGNESLPLIYYVLGQGAFGGTTLRMVSEGVNVNLGPSTPPVLESFIKAVITRPQSAEANRRTGLVPPLLRSSQAIKFPEREP